MIAMPFRVLAADDDPTAGLLMQAALGGGDFLLTLADNGRDALAEFRKSTFDIVLLDVEMSGLDGFEVCAAIRQSYGRQFPVVFVTGRTDAAFVERAQLLSASHIAKPVDWKSLAGQLRALLSA